jgi:hypothetical protein
VHYSNVYNNGSDTFIITFYTFDISNLCILYPSKWPHCKYKGKAIPIQAWTDPEAPRFSDNRHIKVARLPALRTGRLSRISVRGWIDSIGNRTCDLSFCIAVPQPTVPPRTPHCTYKLNLIYLCAFVGTIIVHIKTLSAVYGLGPRTTRIRHWISYTTDLVRRPMWHNTAKQ